MKKKNAVMLADTRPALVGHVLLQLQQQNAGLFDEAIIFYEEISEADKNTMSAIMPCRFVEYIPPLPASVFELERFKQFSKLMFARYEMFSYLDEFETVTWLDTDILIQGDISSMLEKARTTGAAFIREDPVNKTAFTTDTMRTCFFEPIDAYDMGEYLYCSGTIVITDLLKNHGEYANWCYKKTAEWADNLVLPDQGVLNALIQEFAIPVSHLKGAQYCMYPDYARDCTASQIVHSWGVNKFWNDWYLFKKFPQWDEVYQKWLALGGSAIDVTVPKVSVIIPVFKPDLNLFRECMDSLLAQMQGVFYRFSNFEIIIVAEPFNKEALINFVQSFEDPRITLLLNEKRLGIAASLNKGMRAAKGLYIARMDDDDVSAPTRLMKQMLYLDNNPDKHLCTTYYTYFGDMNEARLSFEGEQCRAWSLFTCPFDHPTIMFRKDFFFENNLFYDETRSHVEDWELVVRCFEKGMVVGLVPEILYHHRWHAGAAGQADKTIAMMQEMIASNFMKLGTDIPSDLLGSVAPWCGKVSDDIYKKVESIFDKTLELNKVSCLYDQDALKTVFAMRLNEAKTDTLAEISATISYEEACGRQPITFEQARARLDGAAAQPLPPKQRGFRAFLKKLLAPFYRPIQARYENRIISILETVQGLRGDLSSINNRIGSLETYTEEIKKFADVNRDRLGSLEAIIQNDLPAINSKLNSLESYAERNNRFAYTEHVNNSRIRKKIFLIGTPEHDNIGDAAIALGTYEFISRYFAAEQIVEITGYQLERKYEMLEACINADDIILLQGGGNLGNMYIVEEKLRRRIISDFPQNKIFIMPQTIFFTDDEAGRIETAISAEIYNRHNNLTLFTRGLASYKFAKTHFPGIKVHNFIDMALLLERNYRFNRKGVLLCIRDLNDESGIDETIYNRIPEIAAKFDPDFYKTENRFYADIPEWLRGKVVNAQLKHFAEKEIVVTDRLHGLIFAVATRTPCVVFGAYTQKIKEFCAFFNDSNAVFFLDKDITKLEDAMNEALKVKTPEYPVLDGDPFEAMYKIISEA